MELKLKLDKITRTETNDGTKTRYRLRHSDAEFDIVVTIVFDYEISTEWDQVLGAIPGNTIRLVVGSDEQQSTLEGRE